VLIPIGKLKEENMRAILNCIRKLQDIGYISGYNEENGEMNRINNNHRNINYLSYNK
jgi:hypothetical protein